MRQRGRAPPAPEEEIRERLADRAAALARGSAAALRATSSGGSQEVADRRWAWRLARVPLASARYEQVEMKIDGGRATVSAARAR